MPTRRARPPVSLQSVNPVTAEPTAPIRPITTAVSEARAHSLRSLPSAIRSNTNATVHAPSGTSVIAGCNGCPNHDPCRKSLIFRPAVPPASKALTTAGCTAPAVLSSQSRRAIKSIAVSDVIHFLLNFDLFFQSVMSIPSLLLNCGHTPLSPEVDKSAIIVPGDLPVWDCDSSVAVLIHLTSLSPPESGCLPSDSNTVCSLSGSIGLTR